MEFLVGEGTIHGKKFQYPNFYNQPHKKYEQGLAGQLSIPWKSWVTGFYTLELYVSGQKQNKISSPSNQHDTRQCNDMIRYASHQFHS